MDGEDWWLVTVVAIPFLLMCTALFMLNESHGDRQKEFLADCVKNGGQVVATYNHHNDKCIYPKGIRP